MVPTIFLGLLLVTPVLIVPALSCIPCDKRGTEAQKRLGDLLQDRLQDSEEETHLTAFAKAEEDRILQYLQDKVQKLDDYSINQILMEYNAMVDVLEQNDDTEDEQLFTFLGEQFQNLQKKVDKIVQESGKRRCPNKQDKDNCGLLVQTLMDCKTCERERIVCAGGAPNNQEFFEKCSCICAQDKCFDLKTGSDCTPCQDMETHLKDAINCGERDVTVREGKDPILHCSLEWFPFIHHGYEHVISKITNPVQEKTKDDVINLEKDKKLQESGKYMCRTVLSSGLPVADITFNVKVIEHLHFPTYTNVPKNWDATTYVPFIPELKLDNLPLYVIFAAGGVTILLFFCIRFFIYLWRKIKSKEPKNIEPV